MRINESELEEFMDDCYLRVLSDESELEFFMVDCYLRAFCEDSARECEETGLKLNDMAKSTRYLIDAFQWYICARNFDAAGDIAKMFNEEGIAKELYQFDFLSESGILTKKDLCKAGDYVKILENEYKDVMNRRKKIAS